MESGHPCSYLAVQYLGETSNAQTAWMPPANTGLEIIIGKKNEVISACSTGKWLLLIEEPQMKYWQYMTNWSGLNDE